MLQTPRAVTLVGIINCTPDSFSEHGINFKVADAIRRSHELMEQGADLLDIGGDSTRPGSICSGVEEEWSRIAPVIKAVARFAPLSVDTHHAEIAHRAIEEGVSCINDVGGGSDPAMLYAVSNSTVKYIPMFSTSGVPHEFRSGFKSPNKVSPLYEEHICEAGSNEDLFQGEVSKCIYAWLQAKRDSLREIGILQSRLILDPGMGAFLSSDPEVSWEVLRSFSSLADIGCALMLGCSRKGFLREKVEQNAPDRDAVSALCGVVVAKAIAGAVPLFIRVHNVALQKRFLQAAARTGGM